jgi:hypothetical protein
MKDLPSKGRYILVNGVLKLGVPVGIGLSFLYGRDTRAVWLLVGLPICALVGGLFGLMTWQSERSQRAELLTRIGDSQAHPREDQFVARPVWWHFAMWGLFTLAWPAFFWALGEVRAELALSDPARVRSAEGEIVDRRVLDGRNEVRYRFRIEGSDQWYSAADGTGRRELWTPVRSAESDSRISVNYLPEDPWHNRPVNRWGMPVQDSAAGAVLFAGLCAVWSYGLVLVFRNRAACRLLAERRQLGALWFWSSQPRSRIRGTR